MHDKLLDMNIVLILTVGFTLASILGYLAQRINLSPILGYLLAGYLIGPYSPGFVADAKIAEELAEIGVILMMFSVGLNFKLEDLMNVKNIAIPGAIGQTFVAALSGTLLLYFFGWPWEAGLIMGLAIGVASTVILVRMLADNRLLHTPEGHIAIGWLIVEDIITVAVLLLIPVLENGPNGGHQEGLTMLFLVKAIGLALLKFFFLALFMFTIGQKIVTFCLSKIVQTHSHELFTVAILAMTFLIAMGSSYLFGTSIALGAFIAGMVMGLTHVRQQVSTNALPLKDAFVVIFFLTIGMLFDLSAIYNYFPVFIGLLAIILVMKPLTAYLITWLANYPTRTSLVIAVALAQIGEFSFILAEEANRLKIMPDLGYDILVACALVSISLNPILFRLISKRNA